MNEYRVEMVGAPNMVEVIVGADDETVAILRNKSDATKVVLQIWYAQT